MDKENNIDSRLKIKRLLLISGSGKNCGKTSLACKIIKQISVKSAVYALKISPHFHTLTEKQILLIDQKGFKMFLETELNSNKDSSRMLSAGASKSLYLQCEDLGIKDAVTEAIKYIPEKIPIVCESGSLAFTYQPGLHLLVEKENQKT